MPELTAYNPISHLLWKAGFLMFGLLIFFVVVDLIGSARNRFRNRRGDLAQEIEEIEARRRGETRAARSLAPASRLRDLFFTPIRIRRPSLFGSRTTSGLPIIERKNHDR